MVQSSARSGSAMWIQQLVRLYKPHALNSFVCQVTFEGSSLTHGNLFAFRTGNLPGTLILLAWLQILMPLSGQCPILTLNGGYKVTVFVLGKVAPVGAEMTLKCAALILLLTTHFWFETGFLRERS